MHEPDRKLTDELNDEQLNELLHTLRAPEDIGPQPGFYAKVMDRIESQQKRSIWSVFLEPVFSKRLAFASMALIVLMGVALFNANPQDDEEEIAFQNLPSVMETNENDVAPVLGGPVQQQGVDALRAAPVALMDAEQGRNVVLVDLVSYQEH